MISKKTVFILGAGASSPYDYPTGPKLVEEICSNLKSRNTKTKEIAKALADEHPNEQDLNWYEEKIVEFRNRLIGSKKTTIDSFLRVPVNESLRNIGKLAIAQALIPCENRDRLNSFKNNWYKELYVLMEAPFENLDKNQCRFVTFNYDRSLDWFLFDAIQKTYNINGSDCVNKISSLLPIHLHGQLNVFPWQSTSEGRDYAVRCTPFLFKKLARNIKIVYDDFDVQKSPEFQTAYRLIADAEKIFFIGFGYDEVNLKRLNINRMKGKTIIGTKHKLDRRDYISAQGYFRKELGDDIQWVDQDAETFLKEVNVD